jgi:hypothetical protein
MEQLCLAFAALVGATTGSSDVEATIQKKETTDYGYALAKFCVDTVIGTSRKLSVDSRQEQDPPTKARLHRLHLMLISAISSLPLVLLPSVLDEIREVITKHEGESPEKREMVDALFREIMEKVGDREKEFVIRWWGEESPKFEVRTPTGLASDVVEQRKA